MTDIQQSESSKPSSDNSQDQWQLHTSKFARWRFFCLYALLLSLVAIILAVNLTLAMEYYGSLFAVPDSLIWIGIMAVNIWLLFFRAAPWLYETHRVCQLTDQGIILGSYMRHRKPRTIAWDDLEGCVIAPARSKLSKLVPNAAIVVLHVQSVFSFIPSWMMLWEFPDDDAFNAFTDRLRTRLPAHTRVQIGILGLSDEKISTVWSLCALAAMVAWHPELSQALTGTPLGLIELGVIRVHVPLDAGEFYRYITSTFLHDGSMHLSVNMFGIVLFASPLAKTLGLWRFWLLVLLSALCSGMAIQLFSTTEVKAVLGASGVLFGLFGATATGIIFDRSKVPVTLLSLSVAGIVCAGLCELASSLLFANISHMGHLSGFITGSLVCLTYVMWDHRHDLPGLMKTAQHNLSR